MMPWPQTIFDFARTARNQITLREYPAEVEISRPIFESCDLIRAARERRLRSHASALIE